MMNIHDIFLLDFAYLETFSTRKDTTWGSLFCNESQPDYYDANHAYIYDPNPNHQTIIDEVVSFYEASNILPRFYIYNVDAQQELISKLKQNQFGFEELTSPVQLWDKKILEQEQREGVTIEVVTDDNYSEALAIECSIKEFGGKEIREKAFEHEFKHSSFIHYLLRFNGMACATACLFITEKQARMESVATLEAYRGRGLIGDLIHYIQNEAVKLELENLWVFPINENIEKVYQKYGFQTVETLKKGHAFLGGKSIKEIRG
ncbi:GNAT family N-acetyltransferase [Paenisporosarcina antarctica]|uniref:GNAT family N-acetyltransferase n=1 Tax=Paenisporosarcina antarctica TaxID=417367 RepID=A0A4P7A1F4_9BACL|nr:GNAT family N-acetyltransferase [Paenisporosarcina antarctica]QBP42637.1 GNAT family N-acetyltransferase [Paenisporosarcina antarctica]